jgi:hypothetical protein
MGGRGARRYFFPTIGVAGSVTNIVYSLLDLFATSRAVGAVNGTSCEPGPGTRAVSDTENKLTISGGKIVFSGGKSSPGYGDPGATIGASQARSAGRAIVLDVSYQSGVVVLGWGASAVLCRHGSIVTNSGSGYMRPNFGVATGNYDLVPYTLSVAYRLLLVQRSTGTFLAIRGGTEFPNWTLVWVDDLTTTTPLYASLSNYNGIFVVDNVGVVDLSGALAADGWATSSIASPSNPQTATSTADAIVSFVWTPGAAETLNLMVRRVDDDNTWIVRCDQAASKIYLYEKEEGAETERGATGGLSQTWTVSTAYHIVVRFAASDMRVTVDKTAKQAYTSASFQSSATGVKVSGFATGADLFAWPIDISAIVPGALAPSHTYYFVVGDSKSLIATYPPYLTQLLNAASERFWSNALPMAATGGATVNSRSLTVETDLAANTFDPDVVLCNLGTNDLASLPAEATWKADYTTIITAIHARWPSAKIYVSKPVLLQAVPPSTPHADTATLHGWVDDLVALYSYVYDGIDEADLEGGDGYATNFSDTAHQTEAGQAAVAALWKTAMGY